MSMAAAIIAAERAERLLVEHLRDAGAVQASAATSMPNQRWVDKRVLRSLVRAGAVHETDAGHYLDETAYAEYTADRTRRRQTARLILIPLVIAASLFIWWASTR